jgi:hypothetical protein
MDAWTSRFSHRRQESVLEIGQAPTVDAGLWFQSQVSTYTVYPIKLPIRLQDINNSADV